MKPLLNADTPLSSRCSAVTGDGEVNEFDFAFDFYCIESSARI